MGNSELLKPAFKLLTGAMVIACAMQSALAQSSDQISGLIEEYCTKCHNFDDYSGGIDLEGIGAHNIAEFPEVAEQVSKDYVLV